MSSSDTRQNHPLIPRAQTYVLDRKIISFHSCDRDYKKWPHANHFEINLPESLLNVQSMRLVTVSLPSNQYVFSNEYQNTKLSFMMTLRTNDCELSEGCSGASEGLNCTRMIQVDQPAVGQYWTSPLR